ncbi:SGNH hydrolase [Lophium mytilinum]|uniref:SGNH hydrolase n=1 Tax=Lophium mytilinum TaxID=390894 RepID=A0A6A6QWE4_9PEZI|nr:SGNH hydrolase [Lophium mytilinum]
MSLVFLLALSIVFLATTSPSLAVPHSSSIPSIPSIPNIADFLRDHPLYTRPIQPITTILAIGDSYTAGEGANGSADYITTSAGCDRYKQSWPLQLVANPAWDSFNSRTPDLVFGACSGAKMDDLVTKQLKPGIPNEAAQYTKIGKPQIAVMTIGGNDANFFGAINDCILHITPPSNSCPETLASISTTLASPAFKSHLATTLTAILTTGRAAAAASPPESFQLYLAGYVPFFNADDAGCDNVSWNVHGGSEPKLTRGLRESMNGLVELLNKVLAEVARAMRPWGVFYVEGFEEAFGGHRFCEPAGVGYLERPTGVGTWFWHIWSGDGGAGELGGRDGAGGRVGKEVLEDLVSEAVVRGRDGEAKAPVATLQRRMESGELAGRDVEDVRRALSRVFHPKGVGYAPFAKAFLDAIRSNRG